MPPWFRRAKSPQSSANSLRLLVGITIAFALLLPLLLNAAPPGWWADRGVTDATKTANDYAAVNQGQVKFMAEQAMAEMDAYLPGGAGDAVHQIVAAWGTPTAATNDFAAVNLGQLKALAQPFYDQLIRVTYAASYPWNGSLAQANNYAVANIGQVKNLFSFDLSSVDSAHDANQNGLPDWWENYLHVPSGVHASDAVPWNPSLTYGQAFQQKLNPVDFYNGQTPKITPVSGTSQTGPPNGFVPLPLIVSVTDDHSNPFTGAPVTFTVSQGGGQVQKSSMSAPGNSITVFTDLNGQARAFFKLPNLPSNTSQVTATTGSGSHVVSASFTETSDSGNGGSGGGGSGNGGGSYASPFDPTNVTATLNGDGSMDVTWTNNADPADPDTINIQDFDENGVYHTIATAPAGATSCHIPAP